MPETVQDYRKIINEAHRQIDLLQEKCSHPNPVKKPNSDRDDYDAPGKGVHFWYDCFCPDCEKHYTIPQ